jgi:hypothetical protein
MLTLVFAAALASAPPAECKLDLAPGETLIERRSLDTKDDTLEAVSVREPDTDDGPSTRAMVLGPDCKVMFEQRFALATQARFSMGRLGPQPFLFMTAFEPGGSGCHYDHLIIPYGGEMSVEDGVQPLAPMSLGHSNMDGIFVGDLGRGRGPGLVAWGAEDDDAHYSPHQYQIVVYRWRDGRFVGPKVTFTKRRYDPAPDAVASRLGFGFRDMTQQERFGEC